MILPDPPYLAFPLRIGQAGPSIAGRAAHVRQQIEQVLFTVPGERVFRPEFGAGVRALIFEPNASALQQVTRQRLVAALADALQGEVDPRTLEVEVGAEGAQLRIAIGYTLAAIGQREQQVFALPSEGF